MKFMMCFVIFILASFYALAAQEIDDLRMVKINVHILQGKCLDRLEDMHDNDKIIDPEFYFLVGKVSAYDDCIKIINVVEARKEK